MKSLREKESGNYSGSQLSQHDHHSQEFQENIWSLPVEALLYVRRSTRHKLYHVNILTIGDLAKCDPSMLHTFLSKWSFFLWSFANGIDQ
jgi:DNA polymerase IV